MSTFYIGQSINISGALVFTNAYSYLLGTMLSTFIYSLICSIGVDIITGVFFFFFESSLDSILFLLLNFKHLD